MRVGNRTIDMGLSALDAECNAIYVCSQEPFDFTSSITTYALGNNTGTPGSMFGSPADVAGGRQVTSVAFANAPVTASGTAAWWAAVDTVNLRFLASGPLASPIALQAGQLFGLTSFSVELFAAFNVSALGAVSFVVPNVSCGTPSIVAVANLSASALLGTHASVGSPLFTASGQASLTAAALTISSLSIPAPSFGIVGAYNDGSANAPSQGIPSAIQFPHLLDVNSPGTQTYGETYVTRPPWKVPGVDYAVGIDRTLYPNDSNLKDPGTQASPNSQLAANGMSFGGADFINVSGNNHTVDGWDFSLHSGYQLQILGNNCTVTNCKFASSRNFSTGISSVLWGNGGIGHVFKYNYIDGTNGPTGVNALCAFGPVNSVGTFVVQYNYIANSGSECLGLGVDVLGCTFDCRFNVIRNGGLHSHTSGLHGDWFQPQLANGRIDSLTFDWNLWLQDIPNSQGATQGIAFTNTLNNSQSTVDISIQHNTIISIPIAYVNFAANIYLPNLQGTGTVQYNYVDTSGINSANGGTSGNQVGGWLSTISQGAPTGPYNGTLVYGNNTSLLDGSTIIHN